MKIAFRVDASAKIGTGHLMRCLTLADVLKKKGAETYFICRHLPYSMRSQFPKRGHRLSLMKDRLVNKKIIDLGHSNWLGVSQEIDAHDALRVLAKQKINWIIVDHYALDFRWERILHKTYKKIMVIDDIADRRHECEILLDQNYYPNMRKRYLNRVPRNCKVFVGPKYALLDSSYAELHRIAQPRDKVKNILVFLGGADFGNITSLAIEALMSIGRDDIRIDVVLPVDSRNTENIYKMVDGHKNICIHNKMPTLSGLMASADLAIGAMGATTWERLCLGLPSIAITLAENQIEVAFALQKRKLVAWIGHVNEVTKESITKHVKDILNIDNLASWSKRCMNICDGKGTERIARQLFYKN